MLKNPISEIIKRHRAGYILGIKNALMCVAWLNKTDKTHPLIVQEVFPESKMFYALNEDHDGYDILAFLIEQMELRIEDMTARIVTYNMEHRDKIYYKKRRKRYYY